MAVNKICTYLIKLPWINVFDRAHYMLDIIFYYSSLRVETTPTPHHILPQNGHLVYTVCPKSSDPFYIVSYYIKWVTTSLTHSIYLIICANFWITRSTYPPFFMFCPQEDSQVGSLYFVKVRASIVNECFVQMTFEITSFYFVSDLIYTNWIIFKVTFNVEFEFLQLFFYSKNHDFYWGYRPKVV